MSYSSEPMLWTLGMDVIEDRGHTPFSQLPPAPQSSQGPEGDDPYARRLRRVSGELQKRRSGRIHTPYDEQDLLATPRGTRTKFLVDRAIGSQASGITQVMIQFAPGKTQSLHRHPGEAWLYVVEGRGHSFMGTAPDQGEHYRWKKGDLIIVDHFLWHQHFNDDPKGEARLVRVHMFDSILETMRALTDPLVLFEEAEDTLLSMKEISQIEWPDDRRPES
jgi:gentisate 1,2-dioxygenase